MKLNNCHTSNHNCLIWIVLTLLLLVSSSQQQQRRPPQRGPNRQGLPPPPSRTAGNRPPFRPKPGIDRNRLANFNGPINSNRQPPLPELRRPPRQPQKPYLLPGFDLSDFELPEDTAVGEEVYTLKAADPSSNGGNIKYALSGDQLSVNVSTGVIRLKEKLDRERQDTMDVIVNIYNDLNIENLVAIPRSIKGNH